MSDPTVPWRDSPSFAILCDLAAEGQIVALTGAGFSWGLDGAHRAGLPGWRDLLAEIADVLAPTPARPSDLAALVDSARAGNELIELASMLSALDETRFAALVRRNLTPKPMADQPPAKAVPWTEKHEALLALRPLGIVTMNIDELHEAAVPSSWSKICPLDQDSDTVLREIVRDPRSHPFVLQAHGALTTRTGRPHHGLVFTWESYRDLLATRPAYSGFMVHLFTATSFLFVGYGLSDLDFDQLLWRDAVRFGASVREHIVIDRWPTDLDEQQRKHAASAIKATRYGINTIWVDSFDEVTEVLELARTTPGPRLRATLDACFADDVEDRHHAHDVLRGMGEVGKAIATAWLIAKVKDPARAQRDEAIYALGRLEPEDDETRRQITDALIEVALTDDHVSPVAHALGTLHGLVREVDLAQLERIVHRMRTVKFAGGLTHEDGDPDERLPVYAEYLVLRVRARHGVTTPRPIPPGP